MTSELQERKGSVHGGKEMMPVLFLGHGNPMNAILENRFTEGFRNIAALIPKPDAILCISAHWETRGTMVTAMKNPPTLHDFGGFPRELYSVIYPAPGSPELAAKIRKLVKKSNISPDFKWGLDHGSWSVIRHLYPDAGIPVVQMSIDYDRTINDHYELAGELSNLRNNGVLIIGSGNMVHNLSMIDWTRLDDTEEYGYDWAFGANEKIKINITNHDYKNLVNYNSLGRELRLAVPTPEHFLPLIYCLALSNNHDEIVNFNDTLVAGSISMTSLFINPK